MNDQLATILTEQSGGSLLVTLSGEIDLSNVDLVHRQLEDAAGSCRCVTVDLTGVEYLDSQGLRLFKQLFDKLAGDGTELLLVAPPDCFARQVFELAQLGDYLEIRDTADA